MTQTSHELANFFVEASKALEELPHVKSKLSEVEESLAICRDINGGKDQQIANLLAELTQREQTLAQERKLREDAEFAAMEAKDAADKLIASISEVMKGAAAINATLNPTPAPSSTISDIGASNASQSESSSEAHAPSSGSEQPGQSEHTSVEPLEEQSRPLDVHTTADSPQPATYIETPRPTDVAVTTKPFANLEYWDKPANMSWQTWVDGGGGVAPWAVGYDS